jgi:tRNA dimethylallyltransferase
MALPAVLLMGPTASGKSALVMRLAERFPIEIISVDSAQVYVGMDIGTAKPAPDERSRVPHHLIDILAPTQAYSAAKFVRDASALVGAIRSRHRIPVLTGGTMLYFKALREGLSSLPEADAQLRARIDLDAATRGWPALHAELARLDPVTAGRLKPNDSQRIQRALEVLQLTGRPMSSLVARPESAPDLEPSVSIGLVTDDRARLHERIRIRFESMIDAGLVEELRGLRRRFELSADMPSMRSVGYRQAWQLLDGAIDAREFHDRGIYATRQLAKRQLTWLRSMKGVTPLECFIDEAEQKLAEAIERAVDSAQ